MGERVRWGILGTGKIAGILAEAIAASSTAELVAVGCPQCTLMLEGVVAPRPEIKDIAELVAEAIVETPVDYVERLAREKATSVPGTLVLGADTTVVIRDEILEKPADAADALRMLQKLQGRTHQVVTSVALVADGTLHQATDVTNVVFRKLSDEFLEGYVATGEPMDKAGAYGIQGYGAALVERIEGDFFSVMGLPLRLVLRLLEEAGEPYEFGAPAGAAR